MKTINTDGLYDKAITKSRRALRTLMKGDRIEELPDDPEEQAAAVAVHGGYAA